MLNDSNEIKRFKSIEALGLPIPTCYTFKSGEKVIYIDTIKNTLKKGTWHAFNSKSGYVLGSDSWDFLHYVAFPMYDEVRAKIWFKKYLKLKLSRARQVRRKKAREVSLMNKFISLTEKKLKKLG